MSEGQPYATGVALALMGLVAWKVTGFLPTESSLSSVWWSRETMQAGQWGRLFTSTFAHGGPIHLGFNALALVSLAGLERELGTLRYSAVFLAAAIGGNLAHALTTTMPAVGASGAIFGLLGLLLAMAPWTRLSLFGIPTPAALLLPAYAAFVLLIPGLSELAPIAHFAHLGGLTVGLAAGLAMDPVRAAEHLVYAGAAFSGVAVIVVNVRAVGLDAIVDALAQDGFLGLVALTWPSLVGLVVLGAVLSALPEGPGEPEPAQAT